MDNLINTVVEGASGERPPIKFNLNVKKKTVNEEEEPVEELKMDMWISKNGNMDGDRNVYFIKLVAGYLGSNHRDLIVVENKFRNQAVNQGTLQVEYRFNDVLLAAWADALEELKMMIRDNEREMQVEFQVNDSLYTELVLMNESLLIAFAKYVAFLIGKGKSKLIMKYNTQFELGSNEETEERLLKNIMRQLHESYIFGVKRSILKQFLIDEYF